MIPNPYPGPDHLTNAYETDSRHDGTCQIHLSMTYSIHVVEALARTTSSIVVFNMVSFATLYDVK